MVHLGDLAPGQTYGKKIWVSGFAGSLSPRLSRSRNKQVIRAKTTKIPNDQPDSGWHPPLEAEGEAGRWGVVC